MNLMICSVVASAFIIVSIVGAVITNNKSYTKSRRLITPFNILFAGVFIATLALMLPLYDALYASRELPLFQTVLFAIQGTFQVFTINAESSLIVEGITESAGRAAAVHSVFLSVLFVIDPIFTFGFLASLFKNVSAYYRFFLQRRRELYVFSELNEKSLTLASDIKNKHPKAAVVFTDVFENNEEESYELIGRAREIGGICFKKDILAVNLKMHSSAKPMFLFAIGSDESENICQAPELIRLYGNVENSRLYVFTTHIESELLLAHNRGIPMKVRRINEVRSLINRVLYERGVDLFRNALPADGDKKKLHAIIVGLGNHGTEMLKALTWYCQMDGYRIEIDAFDRDTLAEERFTALCPELMSERYNGVSVRGEAEYTIRIHSGIDVEAMSFTEAIQGMNDVTYAFVALGLDENNIKAAVNLRMLFERSGIKPVIHAVIYNTNKKNALSGITNYRGQAYDVECIGDLESSFSEKVIINSALESYALQRHLRWGEEEEFWQYEYNYRSSIASAIHIRARQMCGIPGADKPDDKLTEEERETIESLEHRRWNAYMRAEGYVYSGSPEKSSRNDLAKMHHDLVDFSLLSDDEKRKDSRVGTV